MGTVVDTEDIWTSVLSALNPKYERLRTRTNSFALKVLEAVNVKYPLVRESTHTVSEVTLITEAFRMS